MRLVDANILMYASFDAFPQHEEARRWLDDALNDDYVPLGIPWESMTAFARLASNPRILQPAISVADAWRQIHAWLQAPCAWIPVPTERHMAVLDPFMRMQGMNHKLVADAHLAALAMEHGLVLVSADTDFARFAGLRMENPVA